MTFKATQEQYTLKFKQPSGTSRGVLTEKDSWLIEIWDINQPNIKGKGEVSIIKTLSPEWSADFPDFIKEVVANINYYTKNLDVLKPYPSLYFAIEMALADLKNGGKQIYYPSDFSLNEAPIAINGLIWMGNKDFMLRQVEEKIAQGFNCIKLKIGAIDFETELSILHYIREYYSAQDIELRVDANGAFSPENALDKLKKLAAFDLHSIEQPIKQGQWQAMQELCQTTPLPIALDEELIGIHDLAEKRKMLNTIQPQFIILKPSLVGGFSGTQEWIDLAEEMDIGWWITSALESNVGLNAIAQFTFIHENTMPQGLGTGQLYTNNTPSTLTIKNGALTLLRS